MQQPMQQPLMQQPTWCATPSTSTPTPSMGGGGLRPVGSMVSIGSQMTMRSRVSARSQSPTTPKSRGHGYDGGRPRCFSSRHVPSVAEEIVQADIMNPSVKMRFSGLMKYLKNNTTFQDRQKSVLFKEQGELLVPEEFDEVLRLEFERRCAFGERMNTEQMSSAKWVKMLRELGVIPGSGNDISLFAQMTADGSATSGSSPVLSDSHGADTMITKAEADIIFHKVVHNCDHGSQRLSYELFCKALCLVSHSLWPDQEEELAFSQILNRVLAIAPAEPENTNFTQDCMLDANVLLVLDYFKPQLHDLFTAFCHRNLGNPSSASHGTGTVRMREKSIWKHTQDTILATSMMGTETTRFGEGPFSPHPLPSDSAPVVDGTPTTEGGSPSPQFHLNGSMTGSQGGGRSPRAESLGATTPRFPLKAWAEGGPSVSFAESIASLGRSPRSTVTQAPKKDPYVYANGTPVIRNRSQFMSSDQFLSFCRDFRVMPELLSRLEVVKIFKRAQTSGLVSSAGASMHGFLSKETFVDACGQLAVEAYAKEPFCDEYPETHEKIFGFFLNTLPDKKKSRHLKDHFMYGRA
mmetsp:Transcript_46/g.124  ORF Transcript_46/g.124 Transcript_46/m.124 type:complete len:578 (-) Transcript_46:456-2189(-)|eukprot:CAMPEP_0206444896 /NCGR_PEP_ID=MMETSP0324_2-20121206/15176_1 /ASSEMBLY_ACC=CAM_ASM_000836 /TAXON_ID=2866 /ORGANISM="Crypthecodinium cohnii, Strain Seligo" /LENGTH=577 /DNA_ID=CAMNT_0053912989 /DNA_START=217 /DNA_END=1950 /DNA_ORIENTATION=+